MIQNNNRSGIRIICVSLVLSVFVSLVNASVRYAFAATDDIVVVSLGDSYSSGEGNEPFYGQNEPNKVKNPDWLAHRSKFSWPGAIEVEIDGVQRRLSDVRDVNWYFVASSGAVTAHIHDVQMKRAYYGINTTEWELTGLDPQIQVFDKVIADGKSVDYVTMTLGGNDLGFTDVVKDGVLETLASGVSNSALDYIAQERGLLGYLVKKNGYLDFNWTENYIQHAWENFDGVGDENVNIGKNIENAYRDVLDAANSTRAANDRSAALVVAGYPKLLTEEDNATFLFDKREVELINKAAIDLDARLAALVSKLKEEGLNIYYVSMIDAFDGHGAYSKLREPFIHPIRFGKQAEDIDYHYFTNYSRNDIIGNIEKMIGTAEGLLLSAYSIHPNELGVQRYAECVGALLRRLEKGKEEDGNSTNKNTNGNGNEAKNRDIALVLDVSGSMAGDPLDATKDAASRFVSVALDNGAQTSLVAYDDDAEVLSEFTTNEAYLKTAIGQLDDGGGTNMESGLSLAKSQLTKESAKEQYIVLMSDGQPNDGKVGDELISYAESIRDPDHDGRDDVIIYALGFNEDASGRDLLTSIASKGCYISVQEASDLEDFFQDMADMINGVKFMYARIACPVDVSVTFNGETLDSAGEKPRTRTSFGSLTFEENESDAGDDLVKVLRLREGQSYEVSINGTGFGTMDYSIGFIDDDGIYSDFRTFNGIEITDQTAIKTTAEATATTTLTVDEDGDGAVDKTYRANANQEGELVDHSWIVRIVVAGFAVLALTAVGVLLWRVLGSRQL